jgi:hypothetical protein
MKTDIELDRAIRASLADIVAAAPEPDELRDRVLSDPVGSPRHRTLLAAAVVVILVAGVISVALVARNRSEMSSAQPSVDAGAVPATPLPIPPDAPAPGQLVPSVAEPPVGFGPFVAARRDGALRTGSWVATAIGAPDPDGYRSPITVSVFEGSWIALDGAETVSIAGHQFRSGRVGDFEVLATTTSPTVAVSGLVGRDLLYDVLTAVIVKATAASFAVTVDPMPDGYVEISPPRHLAADPNPRRTLAQRGGELGINEVSDWVDPLLYAASTAADIRRHDLGDTDAWSGVTTANPGGPIRFLVWSPAPGTVFEIVSTDLTRTADDLIALAATTSTVTQTEFDALYDD